MAFCHILGHGSLYAALGEVVAEKCLTLMRGILNKELYLLGGYCCEMTDGLCLAVFCHPHQAVGSPPSCGPPCGPACGPPCGPHVAWQLQPSG